MIRLSPPLKAQPELRFLLRHPPSRRTAARGKKEDAPVLTLEVRGEVETEESRRDVIWHEIHNAYHTRRILTGQLARDRLYRKGH